MKDNLLYVNGIMAAAILNHEAFDVVLERLAGVGQPESMSSRLDALQAELDGQLARLNIMQRQIHHMMVELRGGK